MNLEVGIVGLPNVGKSTLFNALLKKQAAFVANYPFATIEPNIGIVPVPDARLEKLADIVADEMMKPASPASTRGVQRGEQVQHDNEKRPPIKPAVVNFVDIAGLVKGSHKGEGLGNKFLSHIREVSIIAHVVRAFEDSNIIREGSVGPKEDYEAIKTELILADLQTIQQAQSKVKRFAKETEKSAIEKLFKGLNEGKPAREIELSDEAKAFAKTFFLLSAKPELIVLNVSEADYGSENSGIPRKYSDTLGVSENQMVVICAKIESDLSELSEEEQKQYLLDMGVKESGLERLIKKAYQTLGLISFLTAGEKEIRAWTIQKGSRAVEAAGVIHTDFIKKFIKAEVVSYNDFVSLNGWKNVRENGKARLEGRDYIVNDGDVIEFKIGA